MKVSVIPTIRAYPWGAPGHCMGELVKALSQAGHEVLWFVAPIDLDHREVEALSRSGVRVVPLPDPPPNYVRFPKIRHQVRIWRQSSQPLTAIIASFNPKHIFVNQGGTWCGLQDEFWNCLGPRVGGYSLICHLNKPEPALAPTLFERARQMTSKARQIYFPSAWTQRLAEVQVAASLPNAARFQYPMRFDSAEPLPWPSSSIPRLAMVSRLDTYHKGIDVAFQALAKLRREGMEFALTIYGSGPDENYLRHLAKYLGIEDAVFLAGYSADLQQVWRKEELLLLPSRFEGSAAAITEALGFGRPVLITNVGGAAELVEDGVSGYVCPAAEVNLLYHALLRALAERSQWPEMGIKAHAKIQRQLSRKPAEVFLGSLDE